MEQKWILLNKSEFCWTTVNFVEQKWILLHKGELCCTKVNFVEQKWILLNKSEFCWTKVNFVNSIIYVPHCSEKTASRYLWWGLYTDSGDGLVSLGWLTALVMSLLTHAYDIRARSHPGSPHYGPFAREFTRIAALKYWYCFVVRLNKLLIHQSRHCDEFRRRGAPVESL